MAKTTADFMLGRLTAWGVRNIYGYPGDGISSTLESRKGDGPLHLRPDPPRGGGGLHGFHPRQGTGDPGVCLATSGPGAIHLLNGLYDAKLDHQPVVAIVGQQDRAALGGSYQQEVDLLTLFKDDRAFCIAKAKRCVTEIILPDDVGMKPAVETPPHEHGTVHSGLGCATKPRGVPAEDDLRRAVTLLNSVQKPVIMVGAGAEVRTVAHTGPLGLDLAAGEYGYDAFHLRALLEAGALDVLQADARAAAGSPD